MRRDGKDLHTIQRRVLQHRPLPQVVEFFYSEKGQKIKLMVMAERAAADKAAAEKAERSASASSHMLSLPGVDSSPGKRRKLGSTLTSLARTGGSAKRMR